MRKILIICLLCFSTYAISQAKEGTYYNTNPKTDDIKRVRITRSSQTGQQYIRIYAACGKGECYWGKFKIYPYMGYEEYERNKLMPKGATWYSKYKSIIIDKGFAKYHVYISTNLRHSDHIRLTIKSDYKDPKRKDTRSRNILKLK